MHDKKNLLKLLPAAAVIAAVAVTAVQGKATDGIQKEPADMEIKNAGELSGLLKTAYFDEDTSTDRGTKECRKKRKKQKRGIKKATAKALPDESKRKRQQKVREVRQLRRQKFRKVDIKTELIREAVQDLAEQLPYRLRLRMGKLQQ